MHRLRVLVTGAGGFVGQAVVDRLVEDGHDVVALVRRQAPDVAGARPVRTLVADITNRGEVAAAVRGGAFDAVCHLAAVTQVRESFEHPLRVFDVNVGGTLNLLRALEQGGASTTGWTRFVFASTVAVYGGVEVGEPLSEDRVPAPSNPYGASKLAAEQLVAAQAGTGALGAVILRCFNIAGAINGRGDPDMSRVIPKALAVAAGDAPYFGLNGDGSVVREFTHIADVAEAFSRAVAAATKGETLTVNVGSGRGVSMRDVLAAAERVTGRPVPVRTNPPKPEPGFLVADIDLARRRLGWSPSRSGLERIIHDAWAAIEPARARGVG